MPLVLFLKSNSWRGVSWHRNQERLAREHDAATPSAHFEPWEKQLVLFEIMLLAGIANPPYGDLAYAWGRDDGFHKVLLRTICGRKGDLNRKCYEKSLE